MKSRRVSKRLTKNDLGDTGSHQAAIHVPKRPEILRIFPTLDESSDNPSCLITFWSHALEREYRLRFIHYNNRIVGTGTRDEYRLTSTRELLKDLEARTGDDLVFDFFDDSPPLVSIVNGPRNTETVAGRREISGGWRIEIGDLADGEY